jgi:VIT1/CCC1 family predicted Fe2+/Mn2+ transporter
MNPDYFRNLVFGAEDGLVSTVGVLFGLAISGEYTSRQIILAGLVLIVVEALSMGVGAFLSEKGVHELPGGKKHRDNPTVDGIIMFFSYFVSGFVTLMPYKIMPVGPAKYCSVALTLFTLFMVGYLPHRELKGGGRMVTLAGIAIFVGYVVAQIFT